MACGVCVDIRVQRSTDINTTEGLSCNSIGDASYDVYLSLQDGQSPLMKSVSRGNVECLQLLLDKGADVNQLYKVSSLHHEIRSLPYHVLLYMYIMFPYMNGAYPVKYLL